MKSEFTEQTLEEFKAVIAKEFEHNKGFYEADNYSEEFRAWLKESTDALKMWSLKMGWRMCYNFYKDKLEHKSVMRDDDDCCQFDN